MVRRDFLDYSFFISPDASYMFPTPKDKIRIYAEAIDAVGAH